jgi:hypothetical protein
VTQTGEKRESNLRRNRRLLALVVFFLSTAPLFAQDTPIGPVGTQVATAETLAAAVLAES